MGGSSSKQTVEKRLKDECKILTLQAVIHNGIGYAEIEQKVITQTSCEMSVLFHVFRDFILQTTIDVLRRKLMNQNVYVNIKIVVENENGSPYSISGERLSTLYAHVKEFVATYEKANPKLECPNLELFVGIKDDDAKKQIVNLMDVMATGIFTGFNGDRTHIHIDSQKKL